MLSRCLALCAPSGQSMEDRTEWLLIAIDDVGHYPAEILTAACSHARRTCDHPAKLIPAIVAHAEPALTALRQLVKANRPRLVAVRALPDPAAAAPPPLTQADVDAMLPAMQRIGLSCGALVRNADGTLSPAPDNAA